ncbi:MAG: ABC transporter permease [Clostridiaceae bacterium]|nr:ABC transporter permease [Clostridiaceae bacterium]
MRKVRIFLYIIKQGITGMMKNGFMIFASVSVIFVALFILGSLNLTSQNLQHIMDKLGDKPQIRIDLETETADERVLEIEKALKEDPRVENVVTISKEEQYERLLETFKDKKELFEGYGPELLFVSFEVKLKDSGTGEEFTKDMKNLESVEAVTDILNVVNLFASIKKGIEVSAYVVFLILGVLSILLTMNTIKLTVMARRKELEIMKFIGASESFTRGPFVIEGMFIGIVGAVVAYFIMKYVYGLVGDFVAEKAFFNNFIELIDFQAVSGNLLFYYVLGGVVVGVLSSAFAIRKYIKV